MSVRKEIHELWLSQVIASNDKVRLCNQVRICRNLHGYVFPVKATSEDRKAISQQVQKACEHLTQFKRDWVVLHWSDCSNEERCLLKRLCRLDFPCEETVIAYHKQGGETIIINDGDALRIQATSPHLSLNALWKTLDKIERRFQNHLSYAFDPEKGYATTSPAHYGNGLDIRVFVHIPALSFKRKLTQMQESLKAMQLKMDAVEVIEDKILGHQFFITNTVALGCSEEDLLEHVASAVQEIVQQEDLLRKQLLKENETFVRDSVSRALGVLKNCYELTFEEGMNLISIVLMGIDMGMLPSEKREALIVLWVSMQHDYLIEFSGKTFDVGLEKKVRADVVRSYFETYSGGLIQEGTYVS